MRNKSGLVMTLVSFAIAGSGAFFGNGIYRSVIQAKKRTGAEDLQAGQLRNTFPNRLEIRLNAFDTLRLYGTWLEARDNTHDVALILRDTEQTSADVTDYARHYADAGFHVLLPDLRGCGQSEGKYYGYGYDDRLDVLSWIHWILKRDPKAHIVLHGLGAGANACLLAGAEHLPKAVYAIVSDTAFTSLKAHLIRMLDDDESKAPLFLRLFLLRIVTRILAGYDIHAVSPLNAVKTVSVPTLFLHGEADKTVPVEMCKKLYDEAQCTRQIGVFLGAGHLRSEQTQRERYWKLTDTFIRKYHPERL